MSDNKIFAIDCDGVLLDTLQYWYNWLDSYSCPSHGMSVEELRGDYDLGLRFEPYLPEMLCPYDFFKRDDAYCCDTMVPYEGAKEGIQMIRDAGFQPVIVSYVIGNHFESKLNWCRRHFGISDYEFISTRNKGLVNAVALIDDRAEHLHQMPEETAKILFQTEYETNFDGIDMQQSCWSPEEVERVIELVETPFGVR